MKKLILAAITLMLITQLRAQINVINEPQNNRIIVNFTMPSYRIADTNIYSAYGINQLYKYIYVNDDDFDVIDSIGLPELPCITTSIAIPNNATVTNVTTKNMTWINKPIDRRVFPSQEYSINNASNQFYINNGYYNSSGYSLFNSGYILGEEFSAFSQQGVSLSVLPFYYSPSQSILRELRSGNFIINYTTDINKSSEARYTSGVREDYLSNVFPNYVRNKSEVINYYGKLLIITPQEFVSTLGYFVNYRQHVGFVVDVVTTESIASIGFNIKKCIQQRYDDPEYRPDFVLLVGDTERIPAAEGDGFNPSADEYPVSDLLYSLLKGGDHLADVHVGRWPARNNSEVSTMANKTIKMEMEMHLFTKNATFIAGRLFNERNGVKVNDAPTLNEKRIVDNYEIAIKNNFSAFSVKMLKPFLTAPKDVSNSFNNNPLFYVYTGHCNYDSLQIDKKGNMRFDANSLIYYNSGLVNPITFTFGEGSNNFRVPYEVSSQQESNYYRRYESVGTRWLRSDKGGVTYYGSSSARTDAFDLIVKLSSRIFKRAFTDENIISQCINLGVMKFKKNAYHNEHKRQTKIDYMKSFNLLGDPCFIMPGIGPQTDYVFENSEIFMSGANVVYFADNVVANNNNFVVTNGAKIELKAGERIVLKPGFRVVPGGKFHAGIGSTNGVMSKSSSNNDPVIAEYIANITTEDYFTLNITPNPAVNDINMKINTNYRGDVYVSVYNVMGQLIVSKVVSLGSETDSISTINIDLSDAPSGVLIYELKTTNGKYTGKIIKK